jgi:NAD(P)-dependent dehydrogenase (short-subunit alcohol dehydrogenase family)/acyl carrier protein
MDTLQGGTARTPRRDEIAETVLATIAEVTRYPRSVLRPEAELEDELGIESVKRAEILSVLATRLALPPAPADGRLGRLKTIADVIAAVEEALSAAAPSPVIAFPASASVVSVAPAPSLVPLAPVPPRHEEPTRSAPPAADRAPASAGIAETVIATIAEVTRYPRSVLRLEAELEDELGIESVKRAEIVAVLGRKLDLAAPSDGHFGELKTIADVVAAVEQLVTAASGGTRPVAVPAAVAPPPLAPMALPAPAALAAPTPVAVPSVRRFEAPAPAPVAPRPSPPPAVVASRRAAPEQVFAGKVALVTGSGHGLGKALARHLAHLGASVVVNTFHSPALGGTTVAELSAEGRDAIHVWGSIANPEQLDQIFAAIEARHGHLDFLVHNASDVTPTPLAAITAEDWHRAFRTEVVGLHQAALKAAPLMAQRGGGKIVTLTHPAAHRCFENYAVLGTVKSAVESLTRYLAVELGPRNIQVNAVCAGPLRERIQRDPDSERLLPGWESRSPGRRLPDESGIASAVAFLLSDAASQMAGTTLVVDGGISLST